MDFYSDVSFQKFLDDNHPLESKYDELRKETAKEIFNKLIKITEDEFKGSLPFGVLKAWALEYGLEVE